MQGQIDRLVLGYQGERVVLADIIDYKTDSQLEGARKRHQKQLSEYQSAVSKMHRLPANQIAARLLMVGHGVVVKLA